MTQLDADWAVGSQQEHFVDPLLDALVSLSRYYGMPASADSLTSGLPLVDGQLDVELFPRAAERAGLAARLARQNLSQIHNLLLPCVLLLKGRRCCILLKVDHEKGEAHILQPEVGDGEMILPIDELADSFTGNVFYVKKKYQFDQRSPEVLGDKNNTGSGERSCRSCRFTGMYWLLHC